VLNGMLRNFNTIEDFRNADKNKLMDKLADQVRQTTHALAIQYPESTRLT